MLKRDSNRLFQALAREGFDPRLFVLEHVDDAASRFCDQIVLKGTQLRFFIRQGDTYQEYDCRFISFAPRYPMSDTIPEEEFFNVEALEGVFVSWLHDHAKLYISEENELNLWQQMEYETPLVTGDILSSEDVALFTDEAKRQIKMSISEFRLLVLKEFKPSTEELEVIDGRLTYLAEAVDRLNRIDWRSVAISAIIAISVALTLDTEGGRQLFALFTRAFSGIAGLLPQ